MGISKKELNIKTKQFLKVKENVKELGKLSDNLKNELKDVTMEHGQIPEQEDTKIIRLLDLKDFILEVSGRESINYDDDKMVEFCNDHPDKKVRELVMSETTYFVNLDDLVEAYDKSLVTKKELEALADKKIVKVFRAIIKEK